MDHEQARPGGGYQGRYAIALKAQTCQQQQCRRVKHGRRETGQSLVDQQLFQDDDWLRRVQFLELNAMKLACSVVSDWCIFMFNRCPR